MTPIHAFRQGVKMRETVPRESCPTPLFVIFGGFLERFWSFWGEKDLFRLKKNTPLCAIQQGVDMFDMHDTTHTNNPSFRFYMPFSLHSDLD